MASRVPVREPASLRPVPGLAATIWPLPRRFVTEYQEGRTVKKISLAVAAALTVGTAMTFAATVPAAAASTHVVAVTPAHGQAIPGHYIVTVKGASPQAVAASAHVTPRYVYDKVLQGFAGALNAGQLTALQHNPNVVRIEQDQVAHADAVQYNPPSWGLDRIDQRYRPLDGMYQYNGTGAGTNAYIIDTGIYIYDGDFGGRAHVAYDALGGNGIDCNGHGTHVAGTVGGSAYGVAKSTTLWAVRVLDCNGSGAYSSVIAGMNWVASYHYGNAVANMSLGGGYSADVNNAATNLANSGVFLAVAAGNSSADACNYSPSSAYGTVTVAASDINDNRASFSNYGGCVDLYAPGVNITSDWLNGGTNTISGTSMATPHVTGVGALLKGDYGDQPWSTIASWIINNATSGVIGGNPSGTPNRLLYMLGW
jgi:subtilisin family serine protease